MVVETILRYDDYLTELDFKHGFSEILQDSAERKLAGVTRDQLTKQLACETYVHALRELAARLEQNELLANRESTDAADKLCGYYESCPYSETLEKCGDCHWLLKQCPACKTYYPCNPPPKSEVAP